MLTRRDVLNELKRMGVKKPSLLKSYLRDFERYIGTYYDFQISKTNKGSSEQRKPYSQVSLNKRIFS